MIDCAPVQRAPPSARCETLSPVQLTGLVLCRRVPAPLWCYGSRRAGGDVHAGLWSVHITFSARSLKRSPIKKRPRLAADLRGKRLEASRRPVQVRPSPKCDGRLLPPRSSSTIAVLSRTPSTLSSRRGPLVWALLGGSGAPPCQPLLCAPASARGPPAATERPIRRRRAPPRARACCSSGRRDGSSRFPCGSGTPGSRRARGRPRG
jgi:hypothetical protein